MGCQGEVWLTTIQKARFRLKTFLSFLFLAVYLSWYGTFESDQLAGKIDSFVHYIRIQNWLEAFRDFDFLRSWHPGPYFGYPEDYNYLFVYLPLALVGLFLSVASAMKIFFLVSFILAGYGARKFLRLFFESDFQCFLGGFIYMGSASLVNFGLGSGSVTRMAGYAFFPWALCFFLKWFRYPDFNTRLIFALVFYASYLIHPVSSVGLILAALILALYHRKFPLKEGILLASLALPLFSWQLGSLLVGRSFISWYNVYDFFRGFLLPVDLTTFFGFWTCTEDRAKIFYFGAFPLLLTLASLFSRKREAQLGVLLTVSAMVMILSGYYVFKINTYRFDMVFCLGTAIGSASVLARLKWKSAAVLVALLMIAEQTWYARPFGGKSYLDPEKMRVLKKSIDLKSARQLVAYEWPWIVSRHDHEWISGDYGLHSEGILEISPASLGMLPYVRELQNKELLFRFLGVEPISRATEYQKYLIVEAPSQSASFNKVYRPLLGMKAFDPSRMPLVFKKSSQLRLLTPDGSLTFDLSHEEWKMRVVAYFDNNIVTEKSDFSVGPGHLLVLKEPYHPRVSIEKAVMVEPGLIGVFEPLVPEFQYGLTWWEICFAWISISSLLFYLILVFSRKGAGQIP
jgi:hypothetical protein